MSKMTDIDKANKQKWTLAAIAARNEDMGYFFFERKTMAFFGDVRNNWNVICRHGKVFLKRVREPGKPPAGTMPVGQLREFDPITGRVSQVLNDRDKNGWRKTFPHPLG